MTGAKRVIFAHGLKSSPKGTKAIYLRQELGAVAPALFELSPHAQAKKLGTLLGHEPAVLVGSSLGGLAALEAANLFARRVSHLVLLAPAVGTGRHEEAFVEDEQTRPGLRREVVEIGGLAVPKDVPATIIHGVEDDVVDTNDVLDLFRRSPSARLILVHDDHPLTRSKDLILSVVRRAAAGPDRLVH